MACRRLVVDAATSAGSAPPCVAMRALVVTACLLHAAAALQLPARARVVNRAPAVRMAEPIDPRIEQLINENKVGAASHPRPTSPYP